MSGAGDDAGNGRQPHGDDNIADDEQLLQAIEDTYALPGPYPVVLIAPSATDFRAVLEAELLRLQGDLPFEIRERESRKGTYRSYRVELHVLSPADALAKKTALADLPGVLVAL